jgi:hypothetical protein
MECRLCLSSQLFFAALQNCYAAWRIGHEFYLAGVGYTLLPSGNVQLVRWQYFTQSSNSERSYLRFEA